MGKLRFGVEAELTRWKDFFQQLPADWFVSLTLQYGYKHSCYDIEGTPPDVVRELDQKVALGKELDLPGPLTLCGRHRDSVAVRAPKKTGWLEVAVVYSNDVGVPTLGLTGTCVLSLEEYALLVRVVEAMRGSGETA